MQKQLINLSLLSLLLLCLGLGSLYSQDNGKRVKLPSDTSLTLDRSDLYAVFEMMAGKFSSANQAKRDTNFYSINLVMHPIWQHRNDGYWFYVEQAMTSKLEKPYRQRVYHLYIYNQKQIASTVYELPNPEKYVGAYSQDQPLNNLTPDSLTAREGCTIFLEKQNSEVYAGSTIPKACKSSLRGAANASSEVTITPGLLISWDRGWDEQGKQVWGSEHGGYEFEKTESY